MPFYLKPSLRDLMLLYLSQSVHYALANSHDILHQINDRVVTEVIQQVADNVKTVNLKSATAAVTLEDSRRKCIWHFIRSMHASDVKAPKILTYEISIASNRLLALLHGWKKRQ